MGGRVRGDAEIQRLVDWGVVSMRAVGLLLNIVFIFGNDMDLTGPLRAALSAVAMYALVYILFTRRFGLRRVNLWLIALDIAFISGATWLTGRFESSSYLLFFAEMVILALFGRVALTLAYAVVALFVYYLTVAPELVTPWNVWAFAFRVCVLLMTSVGVGHLGMIMARQSRILAQRAAEEHLTLEREQALGRVASTLASELDHDRVLDRVVQSAVTLLGAAAGWVAIRDSQGALRITSVVNLPAEIIGSDVTGSAAEPGRELPVSMAPLRAPEFACTVTAPIEIGSEQAGLLAVFSRDEKACGIEQRRLLGSLAEFAAVAYTNARLFAERQRKEQHLAVLNAIGRKLVETIDIASVFEDIRRELTSVVSADAFFVATYDDVARLVNVVYMFDDGKAYPGSSFPLNDGVTGQAISSRRVVHINTHAEYEDIPGVTWLGNELKRTRSILVVPMMREERVVGALSIQSYQPGAYDQAHEQLVQTVANQIAVALENSRLYDQMRQLSLQDWLTSLGNARFFFQSMEREIARADRYGHPLSLIMVDSDKLKGINDSYGHHVGDQHVVQLADIIRGQTRQADIAIRYAGDEFLIILPETDETSAMVIAERIRQSVEQTPLRIGDVTVPVTVSLGVAAYPRHGRTAEELFRNVDAALYQAKRSGKNHTSVYSAGTAADGPMPVV
ncbi:MAG: diguanylate cyclase [Chloroflexota bacterium]